MIINSIKNEKIKYFKKLHQSKYRKKEQKYLAYGINFKDTSNCLCIITSNYEFKSEINVIYVTQEVLDYLTLDKVVNEFIFVYTTNFKYDKNIDKVLVLEKIQDPGNMGSIIRSCHALGIKQIIVSEDSVDPFNPKVVAATQGSLESVNIYVTNIYDYLQESNLNLVTTFLNEPNECKGVSLNNFNLCLGNEGTGLSECIRNLKHKNYKIKTYSESLNVSVATGIVLFDLLKGE